MVDNPTFGLPFRFGVGGCAVVEQHSDADIRQSVEVSLRTRRGSRTGLPTFGITNQEGLVGGANLSKIEREVAEHEDRIETHTSRDGLLRSVVDDISVDLNPSTNEDPAT